MDQELIRAMSAGLIVFGFFLCICDYLAVIQINKMYQSVKDVWHQEDFLKSLTPEAQGQVERAKIRYAEFTSHKLRRVGGGLVVFGSVVLLGSMCF